MTELFDPPFTSHERQIIDQAKDILAHRIAEGPVLNSSTNLRNYLRLELREHTHEEFYVLFLDAQHRLISKATLFTGTVDGAAVYPREVLRAVMIHNAVAVILAHNHPSGVCEPSAADRTITKRIIEVLRLIDVSVLDHLIVSAGEAFSFAERGLL